MPAVVFSQPNIFLFLVTTVYVESPVFTREDDDKYKFVSEEVDEFDENQDEALRQSK